MLEMYIKCTLKYFANHKCAIKLHISEIPIESRLLKVIILLQSYQHFAPLVTRGVVFQSQCPFLKRVPISRLLKTTT